MNALSSLGWTCARCRVAVPAAVPRNTSLSFVKPRCTILASARQYSSRRSRSNDHGTSSNRTRRGPRLLYASVAGTGTAVAAAASLSFTAEIKNSYEAAERTGRVAAALAVCINDYWKTLDSRAKLPDLQEQSRVLKECHQRCAQRTLKVLEKNGGVFIKLGQHLSAMNYLLPVEWTSTFIPLQDQCPVSSFESVETMFNNDTGTQLKDYFSEFDPEPVGAASLAQVHLATIRETGQKVAVKVQHPHLAQWARLDVALTRFTFSMLKRFFPEYDLEWLSSEIEVSLPVELDFEHEAQNAIRTQRHFTRIPGLPLVIPDVLWSKKRILVMANETGRRLDDLEYLDANGIDRDEVSASLARIFNEMIFSPGAPLHCDPHGGNIAIRKNPNRRGANFDVILYDHGLYRDIPLDLRRSYAKMWLAVIDGDMERMKKYAKEVAGIPDERFPLFASAITGRDFTILSGQNTSGGVTAARTTGEKEAIGDALQEGLLSELVQMLGQVPRVILLILKTNDLTRALDESLHTRYGPVRTFLILARYCTNTVFLEQVEDIRQRGSLYWPSNAVRLLAAYLGFLRVECKLELFEMWLSIKRVFASNKMDIIHMAGG